MSSLFEFNRDLDAFAKKINVDLDTVVRRVVIDLHDRIVLRTPVDTGRCRASWGIDAGAPGKYMYPETKQAPANAARPQQDIVMRHASPADQVWWIYNNLPYAVALEYGHSRQAPAGMVRVSIAEVETETVFAGRSL